MYIYLGQDSVTNQTGVYIEHQKQGITIVNPSQVPPSNAFNYFFTTNKKTPNDMAVLMVPRELPNGASLPLDNFSKFDVFITDQLNGMIPSRRTDEKQQWYNNILKYTADLSDKKMEEAAKIVLNVANGTLDPVKFLKGEMSIDGETK